MLEKVCPLVDHLQINWKYVCRPKVEFLGSKQVKHHQYYLWQYFVNSANYNQKNFVR